jgi:branched-chain amino acid transport system substrate-binding protein
VTRTIPVPAGVAGIAAGDGGVWVASSVAGVVSRIDPETNRIVAQVELSGTPTEVAVGAGGVWVTISTRAPAVPAGSIGVGVLADCRGPYGVHYEESVGGAETVLMQHGGRRVGQAVTDGLVGTRISGKPVTLALACSDGTASSALREARRLVEQVGVHVLIGPTSAGEEVALQDYARRRPEVAFVNSLAGAQVLDPPPNSFSFLPDAAQWMAGLGAYAYHRLGWRRAATIGDLDEIFFHWPQVAGFIAEFCSLGGTIDTRVWVPRGTDDYAATVARVPRRSIDGIVAAAGPRTVAAFASQYPGLSGDASRRLILGTLAVGSKLEPLLARSPGLRQSRPWPASTLIPGPTGLYGVPYHDAMEAIAEALAAVDGDLSAGGSQFMAALARVRLSSALGPIRLDTRRRAVARVPSAGWVGDIEQTFGGYFKPTDAPPSKASPACVKRTPPPWAR